MHTCYCPFSCILYHMLLVLLRIWVVMWPMMWAVQPGNKQLQSSASPSASFTPWRVSKLWWMEQLLALLCGVPAWECCNQALSQKVLREVIGT
jgi:hypothetical protein